MSKEKIFIAHVSYYGNPSVKEIISRFSEAVDELNEELAEHFVECDDKIIGIDLRVLHHTEEPHRAIRRDNINVTLIHE